MQSRWFKLKDQACNMRRRGVSIRAVEEKLGIPRSTLSYWFKDIQLSSKQLKKLKKDWHNALVKARKGAVRWHNLQKANRFKDAERRADEVLSKIDVTNTVVLDLALAMLYLGEGFKKSLETGIGNSDPLILRFFLAVLCRVYDFDVDSIRCELHLRADQNPSALKRYWSKQLSLPLANFKYVVFDERTRGIKTYSEYKGVCLLRCANVAIQRKLVYLSQKFCERVIKELRA
ncbi:MAG: hypothetical protein Q7S86_04465 [bacterium]|nr:hypothetical protein [bacterium]